MSQLLLEELTLEDLVEVWGIDAVSEGDRESMTIWLTKRLAPMHSGDRGAPVMHRIEIFVPELTDEHLRPIEERILQLQSGTKAPGRLVRGK